MSWKPMIYMRHKKKSSKAHRRSQLHFQNHPSKKLQKIIDNLHLSNLVHKTPNLNKPHTGKGCHKRKDGSLIFLTRNIRKMKTLLQLPLGKEKENICTPRKNEKFLCSGSTTSASKAKFSKSQNCKRVDTRKNFDSGFYEILEDSNDDDYDDECPGKQSKQARKRSCEEKLDLQQRASKRFHSGKAGSSPAKSIANKRLSSNKGKHIRSIDSSSDSTEGSEEKTGKSKKIVKHHRSKEIVFKPLFAKHCGGTWRQIVDEN